MDKDKRNKKLDDLAFQILTDTDRESLRNEGAHFYSTRKQANTITIAVVQDETPGREKSYRIYTEAKRGSGVFKLGYQGTGEDTVKWRRIIKAHARRLAEE